MSDTITALDIHDLSTIPQKQAALENLSQINRIERKTFPSSEAFDFSDQNLWRKKPNTRVLYATIATSTSSTAAQKPNIAAYILYVRLKGVALLHKVCVAEPFRKQGIGKKLLAYVIEEKLRRERGCEAVHLWVDEKREAARGLYLGLGFVEVESVEDYYGPGRRGVKMVLKLG
ncbi:hypothetical protein AJ79_02197 [Helicocarpus griseus UAMH5409]|uniref:N-acetyltransferase domain-containing protein n=1 Tax=Helicocarpus griseus UAMH5409 TaxID=1447875 RepID=A0A2B7Y2V3_9EURO|nr:hypothetical protein AJ79_02197 [Helicocarpus griseus UAMH5409]